MTLLLTLSQPALLAELERCRETLMSEEKLERRFGKPPYWFEEHTAPRYSEFAVQWRDSDGREYMELWEGALGVRLPIHETRTKILELPIVDDALLLTKPGTGHQRRVEVVTSQQAENRTSTGWVTFSEL